MRAACLVLVLTGQLAAGELTASSPAELRAALARLGDGDTLRIAPGEYPGGQHVAGRARLTVTALDPARPPVFVGGSVAWHFSRCPNLAVTHLHCRGQTSNGINVDDGGDRDDPVAGVTLAHLEVRDIGPRGNHDGIKGSGLVELTIRECLIAGWGGQGIDLVGCHRSRITGCHLEGRAGFAATAGVQLKGGCSDIVVERCEFRDAGGRPLNLGGSTGRDHFRPPGARHEAARLTVRDNLISGGECAAAFVGVDGVEFTGNTILFPDRWIFRFLQETTEPGFVPCRDVRLKGNRIVFRRGGLRAELNIGGGTAPETFVFEGNHWFAEDRPGESRPRLPVEEQGGKYGEDPRNLDLSKDE